MTSAAGEPVSSYFDRSHSTTVELCSCAAANKGVYLCLSRAFRRWTGSMLIQARNASSERPKKTAGGCAGCTAAAIWKQSGSWPGSACMSVTCVGGDAGG